MIISLPHARVIGSRVLSLDLVTSTNDIAREFAERGEPEGLVISAEEQIGGRGRMGRKWLVPPRTSIQFSVLLRPVISPRLAVRLTQFSALAVVQSLQNKSGLQAKLKWPNDILLSDKKCGGILVESSIEGDRIIWAVVGIGLNVNFTMREAMPELAPAATTIKDELGRFVDRQALTSSLIENLDSYYSRLSAGEDLTIEWRSKLSTLGQRVSVQAPQGNGAGIARDVDLDGSLLLERPDGSLIKFAVGDVTIQRNEGSGQ